MFVLMIRMKAKLVDNMPIGLRLLLVSSLVTLSTCATTSRPPQTSEDTTQYWTQDLYDNTTSPNGNYTTDWNSTLEQNGTETDGISTESPVVGGSGSTNVMTTMSTKPPTTTTKTTTTTQPAPTPTVKKSGPSQMILGMAGGFGCFIGLIIILCILWGVCCGKLGHGKRAKVGPMDFRSLTKDGKDVQKDQDSTSSRRQLTDARADFR